MSGCAREWWSLACAKDYSYLRATIDLGGATRGDVARIKRDQRQNGRNSSSYSDSAAAHRQGGLRIDIPSCRGYAFHA